MSDGFYILLDDQAEGTARLYENPTEIIRADKPEDLPRALARVEAVQTAGRHVAGYVSYEAGYASEPKLSPLLPAERAVPLCLFGVFEGYRSVGADWFAREPLTPFSLKPVWDEAAYTERFRRVIDYIEAGDVYQINLTFPMVGDYAGSAMALYAALRERQGGRYGGIVRLGGADIVSLSPELFFKKVGKQVDMRPMKGTARRMADPVQDASLRDFMKSDSKSQAENLMIVDLLRNDLSRLCEPGSVKVPELFTLETYPTLHQMTSRVTGRLKETVGISELFRAMFPCGSVTGAPKIRAMEIIHELEAGPRGAYCGSVGYVDPDGSACFNVAIRTLTLDAGRVTYNVGSGVVRDSRAADEYAECLLKADVVTKAGPDLIETARFVPGVGILRAERHMARMIRSAEALGYPVDEAGVRRAFETVNPPVLSRVRITLSAAGQIGVEHSPFEPVINKWRVVLARPALTANVQETRYKVSARDFYDGERRRIQSLADVHEVLFCNETRELCEGSFTSIFIKRGERLLTPALSCGLLPGVLREELLSTGEACEAVLTPADLQDCDALYVGNSLRGLIEVELIREKPL